MNRRYPLLAPCAALITGNVLQDSWRLPFIVLFPLTVLLLALMIRCYRRCRPFLIFCLLFFLSFGALHRCAVTRFPADHIYYLRRELLYSTVTLRGVVGSHPVHKSSLRGERTLFRLDAERACTQQQCWKTSGRMRVDLYRREDLLLGQGVRIKGKLHRPFSFGKDGKFSFRRYLARQGIYFILSAGKDAPVKVLDKGKGLTTRAAEFRNRLCAKLDQSFAPVESAVLKALLLGERAQVPQFLRDRFARTGTAHVLAISGLHVGVVTACLFLFLKMFPVGRRAQYLLTITALAGYVVLTGARASVVRAAVMCSVFLFSYVLERENNSLNTLALAAMVLLLMDPNNIFAIGFQLSFICVLSILLFYPVFRDALLKHVAGPQWVCKYLIPSFAVSLSAWLGAAGLAAYYFGITAPIGIIANLVVIPLITLIVGLGLAFLLTGFWCGPLAVSLSACLKLLLNLLAGLTALFVRVPGGSFPVGDFPCWLLWGVYFLLAFLFFTRRQTFPNVLQ